MDHAIVMNRLRDECGLIVGETAALELDLAKRREALATIDAVIRMFEAASNPDMIPAIRPTRRSPFFRPAGPPRLCLSVLRHVDKPAQCRVIADRVIDAMGLDELDARVRDQIAERVRRSLAEQQRKGIVGKIVDWPETWSDWGQERNSLHESFLVNG